jgi:hypothetical protein
MRTSAPRSLALALAAVVALEACGRRNDTVAEGGTSTGAVGGDVAPGAAAPTTAGAPTPGAAATLAVGDLKLGKAIGSNNAITNETDDFGVRDTIYAVVQTSGSASGQSLVARWTFQDGQVVEESTQPVNSTGAEARTVFRLTKPSAWPKGNYRVAILMNGQEMKTEDFEVK